MAIYQRKRFFFLLGILICAGSIRTHAQLVSLKLQLKWKHEFQFAGYYAAQLKGYYKDEGIDLQILEGSEKISPVNMIAARKADLAISDPEVLFNNPKETPVVAVFATLQSSPYGLLSLPEKGIRRPSDLVGKTILAANDQGWNIFKAIMLKEGLNVSNTRIVRRTKDSEELLDKKADAIVTYYTSQPTRLKSMGINPAIMKPLDYGVDFYGDVVFASRKLADNSPELIEAFNRATRRGWEYALGHKEKMADYIEELPGVKKRGLSKKNLLEEADELEKLILPKFVEIGHMNAGRWQNMLSIYQELGLAGRNSTLKGFLFEAPDHKGKAWYDILIYSLAIGGVLFTLAILLNWELRRQVLAKTGALQKENEERRKAEERLELAIEAAGLGLWELDLDENYLNVNQRWISNQLGYQWDNGHINRSQWDALIHPEDQKKFLKQNEELMASGESSNTTTYRIKTSQNTWKWLLSFRKISQRNENQQATRITGMHLDIDSIKQKELELQSMTRELLKKNSELEKFAYITSHNLRAPVVNLRSLTEMHASGDLPGELEQEVNQKIRQSVKQLDNTLSDLIEIVSSRSGEHIVKTSLSFAAELQQVIQSIENLVKNSGAHIDSNFSEAPLVSFPKKYLNSILLNLLTNAIKYRSAQRPLSVSVSSTQTKDFILLTFSDNGSGIDMSRFKNKVFGLYQRFHSGVEGKGLGLYIIKSQIEDMDGKIEVVSAPDAGTTFRIYFPHPANEDFDANVSAG